LGTGAQGIIVVTYTPGSGGPSTSSFGFIF
jgi:hypothetical protein